MIHAELSLSPTYYYASQLHISLEVKSTLLDPSMDPSSPEQLPPVSSSPELDKNLLLSPVQINSSFVLFPSSRFSAPSKSNSRQRRFQKSHKPYHPVIFSYFTLFVYVCINMFDNSSPPTIKPTIMQNTAKHYV